MVSSPEKKSRGPLAAPSDPFSNARIRQRKSLGADNWIGAGGRLTFPMAVSQPNQAIPTTSNGRGRMTAIALDILRHALPLLPLYLGRGSITSYLLLTAFDLSLGLMLIVATTRDRSDPTTVDPRATWLVSRVTSVLVLAIFFGLVAVIISVPTMRYRIPAITNPIAYLTGWLKSAVAESRQIEIMVSKASSGLLRDV